MLRGEVWLINLDPTIGSEIRKTRPAVIVNDDEPGLIQDFIDNLERLVPYKGKYRHNVGEDNAAAHIWRQLLAHQVVLPITKGELDFGPWEQVFYCEFDGCREKRVVVKVIGE